MIKCAWHVHDRVLVEPLLGLISERKAYIEAYKPQDEITLRFHLLKEVEGKLPKEMIGAGEDCIRAWEVFGRASDRVEEIKAKALGAYGRTGETEGWIYDGVRKALYDAEDAYDRTENIWKMLLLKYASQIEALHKKECPDCPWDGKTIFSNKEHGR